MSKKSTFIKLSMLWEDYEVALMPSPRAGYDVVFLEFDPDTEHPTEIKRRHLSEHDAAMSVALIWAHQVEEGRVQKRKKYRV